MVADLIRLHRHISNTELASQVETYLSRLNAASTYWPGDKEIENALTAEPFFRRFKRGRLRVFLEACEDHLRGYAAGKPLAGGRIPRVGYPIEHLLPQKWETHWPVNGLTAELNRREHIHRFGNLTLLTKSLNSSISNGAWLGPKGKRAKLHEHDVFLLNRRIEDISSAGWDENLIDQRTTTLVRALLATWPVPEGHIGEIRDASTGTVTTVSLKQLVASGIVTPGTLLRSQSGTWGEHQAVVLNNGSLDLDGKIFASPSAAGHHLRQGATNGWQFWYLPDGRRLADARDAYRAALPVNAPADSEPPSVTSESALLDALDDGPYREAVSDIFSTCRALGLSFGWGSTGTSIRLTTSDRSEPLSVAWVFPEGRHWYGLRHLRFGFDTDSAEQTPPVIPALDTYAARLAQIPGGIPAKAKPLNAWTWEPAQFPGAKEAVIKALNGLVNDARAGDKDLR